MAVDVERSKGQWEAAPRERGLGLRSASNPSHYPVGRGMARPRDRLEMGGTAAIGKCSRSNGGKDTDEDDIGDNACTTKNRLGGFTLSTSTSGGGGESGTHCRFSHAYDW